MNDKILSHKLDWEFTDHNIGYGEPLPNNVQNSFITDLKGEMDVFAYDSNEEVVGYIERKNQIKGNDKGLDQLQRAAKHFNSLGYGFMGARTDGDVYQPLIPYSDEKDFGFEHNSFSLFEPSRNTWVFEQLDQKYAGGVRPDYSDSFREVYTNIRFFEPIDCAVPGIGKAEGGLPRGDLEFLSLSKCSIMGFDYSKQNIEEFENLVSSEDREVNAYILSGESNLISSDMVDVEKDLKQVFGAHPLFEEIDFYNPSYQSISRLMTFIESCHEYNWYNRD